MSAHTLRVAAIGAVASLAFTLSGCAGDDGVAGQDGTITPTTGVATETEGPEPFEVKSVDEKETTDIGGEIVEDPGMPVSYKWQGMRSAGGGTVVTVAVINTSESPMPVDALGTPTLTYNGNQSARKMRAEEADLEFEGLDLPLGPGATMNVQYVFDVSPSSLSKAEFKIGNVVFKGNLNN